jgi:hypothetical protein
MKPPYFRLISAAIFICASFFAAGYHIGRITKPAELVLIPAPAAPAGKCVDCQEL